MGRLLEIDNGLMLAMAGAVFSALLAGVAWLFRSHFGRTAARQRHRQLVASAFESPIRALQNFDINLSVALKQSKTTDQLMFLEIAVKEFQEFKFHDDLRKWILASEFQKDEEKFLRDMAGDIEGSTNFFRTRVDVFAKSIRPSVSGFLDPGIGGVLTRFFMIEREVPDSPVLAYVSDMRAEIAVYVSALRAVQAAIGSHRGTGRMEEDAAFPFPEKWVGAD